MTSFAFKRLAAVEIAPETSHQHELNAGALRRGLGFPVGTTKGALTILACGESDGTPLVLEGTFTLYDAREHHPTRSEYRIYYRLPGLVEVARPDDLLVLCRDTESGGLHGILARPGTPLERQMDQLLKVGDHASLSRFFVRTPLPSSKEDTDDLAQSLLPVSEVLTPVDAAARGHPLFRSAVDGAAVPPTRLMAEAGWEISQMVWGSGLGPDEFIGRGLEAESELYFAIEREVGTRSLQHLLDEGHANLDELLSWALRIQQSRKSRRGQSLQHHFRFLLDREEVPYSPQCVTERGETPDFVVPGHRQYHDSAFPSSRLRMVACKSTIRERWGQILKEAARIPEKYVLTVDESLSADVVMSMREVELRVFLPRDVIQQAYPTNASAGLLGTVSELVACLKAVL